MAKNCRPFAVEILEDCKHSENFLAPTITTKTTPIRLSAKKHFRCTWCTGTRDDCWRFSPQTHPAGQLLGSRFADSVALVPPALPMIRNSRSLRDACSLSCIVSIVLCVLVTIVLHLLRFGFAPQTHPAGQLLGSLTRSLWCRRRRSAPSWGLGGQLAVAGQLLAGALAGACSLRPAATRGDCWWFSPQTDASRRRASSDASRRRLAMCCSSAADGDGW
jgi:hypothetical protein